MTISPGSGNRQVSGKDGIGEVSFPGDGVVEEGCGWSVALVWGGPEGWASGGTPFSVALVSSREQGSVEDRTGEVGSSGEGVVEEGWGWSVVLAWGGPEGWASSGTPFSVALIWSGEPGSVEDRTGEVGSSGEGVVEEGCVLSGALASGRPPSWLRGSTWEVGSGSELVADKGSAEGFSDSSGDGIEEGWDNSEEGPGCGSSKQGCWGTPVTLDRQQGHKYLWTRFSITNNEAGR